jgi:histone-lysine N-methyltransferase NSD3
MFNPGDLAWARLGVAPYWPCTITLDPDQKIHSNVSLRGKKPHREYHVQVI